MKLTVDYDPHYCRALVAKPSTWDFHLSDWLRAKVKGKGIWVDGKKTSVAQDEWTAISFSPGARHTLEVR